MICPEGVTYETHGSHRDGLSSSTLAFGFSLYDVSMFTPATNTKFLTISTPFYLISVSRHIASRGCTCGWVLAGPRSTIFSE